MRYLLLCASFFIHSIVASQTWSDSLDNYARLKFLTPQDYNWTWTNAPMMHAMELQYELMPTDRKQIYIDYVKDCMDRNLFTANGIFPNGVASGNGMAFLYRVTGDYLYLDVAKRIFNHYQNIVRASNGGVSHLAYSPELWDDTVYMIGVYLLAMYRATGDITYLDELIEQFRLHKEKLVVEEWGLWVHGWDGDNNFDLDFCSQPNWADQVTRRSHEMWGRGNGWVVVTLSELLNNMPSNHPEWDFIATSLEEIIEFLPELQDELTGHWYQLPVRKGEAGNYIESSCTAMFGYGILTALKYGIVEGNAFESAVESAYYGLKSNSTSEVGQNDFPYLTTTNVCKETCIGDKDYYFDINTANGKAYALAVFIIFGRAYEEAYLNSPITNIAEDIIEDDDFQVFPTVIGNHELLQVTYRINENRMVQLSVTDAIGRTVYQTIQQSKGGNNEAAIEINNWSSGQYFLSIQNRAGQTIASKTFLVQ